MEKRKIVHSVNIPYQSELAFTTSRAGGPGGQNVNKVSTKVTLRWNVARSPALSDEQRATVLKFLARYITREGVLVLTEQRSRSQLANKQAVVRKLDELLERAFRPRLKRKPTKPTKASVHQRIRKKKQRSQKKQWRRSPEDEDKT